MADSGEAAAEGSAAAGGPMEDWASDYVAWGEGLRVEASRVVPVLHARVKQLRAGELEGAHADHLRATALPDMMRTLLAANYYLHDGDAHIRAVNDLLQDVLATLGDVGATESALPLWETLPSLLDEQQQFYYAASTILGHIAKPQSPSASAVDVGDLDLVVEDLEPAMHGATAGGTHRADRLSASGEWDASNKALHVAHVPPASWLPGILIDNVNHMWATGGLQAMVDVIASPLSSLELKNSLVTLVVTLHRMIKPAFMRYYAPLVKEAAYTALLQLPDDVLRDIPRTTFNILEREVQRLMEEVSEDTASEEAALFELRLSLRYMQTSVLTLKVNALQSILDKVEFSRQQSLSSGIYYGRPPLSPHRIMKWIKDNGVVELVYSKSSHEGLLARGQQLLRTLAQNDMLELCHLDALWAAAQNKHGPQLTQLLASLGALAYHLSEKQLEHVFQLMTTLPSEAFVAPMAGEVLKLSSTLIKSGPPSSKVKTRLLDWLWQLMQDFTLEADVHAQAVETLTSVVSTAAMLPKRNDLMDRVMVSIKDGTAVPSCLQLLSKLLATYPERSITGSSTKRHQIVTWLDTSYRFMDVVFRDMLVMKLAAARSAAGLLPTAGDEGESKSAPAGADAAVAFATAEDREAVNGMKLGGARVPYLAGIKARLDFLLYVLRNSVISLKEVHVDYLWNALYVNALTDGERNAFLVWLLDAVAIPTRRTYTPGTGPDAGAVPNAVCAHLFDHVRRLHFASMTHAGYRCFEALLVAANKASSKLSTHATASGSALDVLSWPPIGLDELWDIILCCESEEVVDAAVDFTIRLTLNLRAGIDTSAVRRAFLERAMDHMQDAYRTLRSVEPKEADAEGGDAAEAAPAPPAAPAAPVLVPAAEWACPVCTLLNEWKEKTCTVCDSPRPADRPMVPAGDEAGDDAAAAGDAAAASSSKEEELPPATEEELVAAARCMKRCVNLLNNFVRTTERPRKKLAAVADLPPMSIVCSFESYIDYDNIGQATVEVSPTITIGELRGKLLTRLSDVHQQTYLSYNGQELKDESRTLYDMDLEDGAMLFLAARIGIAARQTHAQRLAVYSQKISTLQGVIGGISKTAALIALEESHFMLEDAIVALLDETAKERIMKKAAAKEGAETEGAAAPHNDAIDSSRPSYLLSNTAEHFDLLFWLLQAEQLRLGKETWALLQRLPWNGKLYEQLALVGAGAESAGEASWARHLDAKLPYRLLYSLQLVQALVTRLTGAALSDWRHAFVSTGGFRQLYSVFMTFPSPDEGEELQQSCLHALLVILRLFLDRVLEADSSEDGGDAGEDAAAGAGADMDELPLPDDSPVAEARPPVLERALSEGSKEMMESVDWQALLQRLMSLVASLVAHGMADELVETAMAVLSSCLISRPALLQQLYDSEGVSDWLLSLLLRNDSALARRLTSELVVQLGQQRRLASLRPAPLQFFRTLLLDNLDAAADDAVQETAGDYWRLLQQLLDKAAAAGADGADDSGSKDLMQQLAERVKSRPIVESVRDSKTDEQLAGVMRVLLTLVKQHPQLADWLGGSGEGQLGLVAHLWSPGLFAPPAAEEGEEDGGTLDGDGDEMLAALRKAGEAELPACKKPSTRQAGFQLLAALCASSSALFSSVLPLMHKQAQQSQRSVREWSFEPDTESRSAAGYVGLRNLGCTCYMNALLQQLYMMPQLRGALLQAASADDDGAALVAAPVVEEEGRGDGDGDGGEGDGEDAAAAVSDVVDCTLLRRLQLLLASLEGSVRKAYDPRPFVDSYDFGGEPVDVKVQQDVEEFFNLLCDKLEAQLSKSERPKLLTETFGGRLVNQIVPKGCGHTSERVEPFYTISVAVKGMSSLEEAMDAYVEGETLEGDNMYMCEMCNKKVEAQKRACLESLPPTVVFHLKRFEFNLRKMTREKINDFCSFPTTINMRRWTREGLAESEAAASPAAAAAPAGEGEGAGEGAGAGEGEGGAAEADAVSSAAVEDGSDYEYELAGVLVHSGTAEGGHYYSFIKERRQQKGGSGRWLRFDDRNVTPFDISGLPDACYGGEFVVPQSRAFGIVQLPRHAEREHSGYLLFYDRVPRADAAPLLPLDTRPLVPAVARSAVAGDNQLALKHRYAFDGAYMNFLHATLSAHDLPATGDAAMLKTALQMSVPFVFDTLCHSLDKSLLPSWVELLTSWLAADPSNCEWVLRYFVHHPQLFDLLVVCPYDSVRSATGTLICAALPHVVKKEELAIATAARRSRLSTPNQATQADEAVAGEGDAAGEDDTGGTSESKTTAPADTTEAGADGAGAGVDGDVNGDSLSLALLTVLVEAMEKTRYHWRQFDDYWSVILCFCQAHAVCRRYMVNERWISLLVDYLLGDKSPLFTGSRRGLLMEKVGNTWQRAHLSDCHEVLAQLVCTCHSPISEVLELETPVALPVDDIVDSERPELNASDRDMLVGTGPAEGGAVAPRVEHRALLRELLKFGHNKSATRRILQHLSWRDREHSFIVMWAILAAVDRGTAVQVPPMYEALAGLVELEDDLRMWRTASLLSPVGGIFDIMFQYHSKFQDYIICSWKWLHEQAGKAGIILSYTLHRRADIFWSLDVLKRMLPQVKAGGLDGRAAAALMEEVLAMEPPEGPFNWAATEETAVFVRAGAAVPAVAGPIGSLGV
eukprot:PLAT6434.1.p1 GENE.PLAT6434.1~~PLAT6434.1.p1  ORF type:complete len:2665 (+),score=1477.87 PLAT6434.1:44-7996(+)